MAQDVVTFGKYELLSRLAAGGMAEIFLARTKSIQGFEKYLVIKKILQNRTNNPDFVRMFLDEARVAATLDHPNIVQIYDVGSVDNEYFIAMEYLRGHNVIEIVRSGARLGYAKPPLEHVMSILSGVCAGLHYAHDKKDMQGRSLEIVHRDVTPQNIVTTFDGAVKIVDFGIAKAATREVETMAGTLKGKIGYMSPEQCKGAPVDRRSDLFAVGIILYELTTGKRLYHERSDFDTLKKIIEGPVPQPRDILPFYPAFLNAIVVRCLQKSADDRYQTARDLHTDLDAFSRDNQLVTGTVPLAQYMERIYADELAAKASGQMTAAQGLPLATMTSSSAYLGEASRRLSSIRAPLLEARRQHRLTRALQAAVLVALAGGGGFLYWKTRPMELSVLRPGTTLAAPPPGAATAALPPQAGAAVTATATPLAPAEGGLAAVPNPMAATVRQPSALAGRMLVGKPAEAHITVVAEPKCEVLVDGMPLGATPVVDSAVVAGRHVITLINSAANIRETQKITLGAGQLWTRSFTWLDGKLVSGNDVNAKMLTGGPAPVPLSAAVAAPAKRDQPTTRPRASDGAVSGGPAPASTAPQGQQPAQAMAPAVHPPPVGAPPVPVRKVAGFVLDSQRLEAPQPHLPEHIVRANSGRTLQGTYRICVDTAGRVYEVGTVASIAGADPRVIDTLKSWKYKPQATNVCAVKVLAFQVP